MQVRNWMTREDNAPTCLSPKEPVYCTAGLSGTLHIVALFPEPEGNSSASHLPNLVAGFRND